VEAAGKNESSLETFLFDGLHPNEAGYQVSSAKAVAYILAINSSICTAGRVRWTH